MHLRLTAVALKQRLHLPVVHSTNDEESHNVTFKHFHSTPARKKSKKNCGRESFQQLLFLREGLNGKKTFSFGHCPNHLNPPIPPIRATGSSFFGFQKRRFARITENISMMIMMVAMIIMVILMMIMTKMTKIHTITVKFE